MVWEVFRPPLGPVAGGNGSRHPERVPFMGTGIDCDNGPLVTTSSAGSVTDGDIQPPTPAPSRWSARERTDGAHLLRPLGSSSLREPDRRTGAWRDLPGRCGVPRGRRLTNDAGSAFGGELFLGGPSAVLRGATQNGVSGDVLVSHTLPCAVPSALRGLTSGFGMGPGVSLPP